MPEEAIQTVTPLRPGHLVALRVVTRGGTETTREEEVQETLDDGSVVTRWRTIKRVLDPEEHAAADKLRNDMRNLILKGLAWTPFAFSICPSGELQALEERIAQAREQRDAWNDTAKHEQIRLFCLTAKFAGSEAEAVAAITEDVATMLADLRATIATGDVDGLERLAKAAKEREKLLEVDSEGQRAVEKAVAAARKIRTAIKQRVAKKGEDLAAVLREQDESPIELARAMFAAAAADAERAAAAAPKPGLDMPVRILMDFPEETGGEAVAP